MFIRPNPDCEGVILKLERFIFIFGLGYFIWKFHCSIEDQLLVIS